jgi:hypothetical protein
MIGEASSTSNHFGGVTPFKVQVNFDISLFENTLEKLWYYVVHKIYDSEKIIFSLLKSLPHVKYWWECYWERHNEDKSMESGI